MNCDDLHHGTIIASEDQRHVLHRLTTAGGPAPTAMLASIPDDDDPDQNVSIRSIVVAVLWAAILEGEVHVLEYGPGPRSSCPTSKPSIEGLMREGHGLLRVETARLLAVAEQGATGQSQSIMGRRPDAFVRSPSTASHPKYRDREGTNMIDHDASGPAPHPESIDSSQCHDGFGFDRHEPAPLSVRIVGGAPIGRATVRSAHAREDVETPDGPSLQPRIEPAPWRRRGRKDRRDAGTWRRSMTRRCGA